MQIYQLWSLKHTEIFTAADDTEAITTAQSYAERYNIHTFVLMDSSGDIIFAV